MDIHQKIQSLISESVDDRLSPSQKQEVEGHAASCAACRAAWEETKSLRRLLKETPPLAPPESFYTQVLRKAQERQRAPRMWLWPMKLAAALSVAGLAVIVTWDSWKAPQKALRMDAARNIKSDLPDLYTPAPAAALEKSEDAEISGAPVDSVNSLVPESKLQEAFDAKGPAAKDKRLLIRDGKDIPSQPAAQAFPSVSEPLKEESAKKREPAGKAIASLNSSLAKGERPIRENHSGGYAGAVGGKAVKQGKFAEEERQILKDRDEAGSREWKGFDSGISEPQTRVIYTDKDWKALWQEHTRNILPPPPVPSVDFDRFMVVAVFSGQKPSGGFSVSIADVRPAPDRMIVLYLETQPLQSGFYTQALTSPFHMKAVPRSDLPVDFQKAP